MAHIDANPFERRAFDEMVARNRDRVGQAFLDANGQETTIRYTVLRTTDDEMVLHDPGFEKLHFYCYDAKTSKLVHLSTSDADLVPSATMTLDGNDGASFTPG